MTFSGLTSRWTMPAECALLSARRVCSVIARAVPRVKLPVRISSLRTSGPGTYSMTR